MIAKRKDHQERRIGTLLRVPHRVFATRVHEGLAAAGFTDLRPPHLIVFQHMEPGGCRLTELADLAQITKQSMNYLVDYLEEAGYVERLPDPNDSRAKIVRLTERGTQMSRQAREIAIQIEADWARHVGKERMVELRKTLNDLIDALDAQDDAIVQAMAGRVHNTKP